MQREPCFCVRGMPVWKNMATTPPGSLNDKKREVNAENARRRPFPERGGIGRAAAATASPRSACSTGMQRHPLRGTSAAPGPIVKSVMKTGVKSGGAILIAALLSALTGCKMIPPPPLYNQPSSQIPNFRGATRSADRRPCHPSHCHSVVDSTLTFVAGNTLICLRKAEVSREAGM